MKIALRLFAPYIAVGIFWCAFSNAWLAILAYHVQILFWSRKSISELEMPGKAALLALPTVLVGPIVYFLLPIITHTDLSLWLTSHHLSGLGFMLMIPYFGIVHPILEQLHWSTLREATPAAHPLFAGYHLLVLYSLLTVPWLMACFVVLAGTSFAWQWMTKRSNNLAVPVVSHVLADFSIVVAACLSAFF